jgi:WD40 repeat protein
VRTVGISADQKFLVTGSQDAILRLWNLESGTCLREFQGHAKEISAAEFASHGRFIISASVDGQIMLWELDWDWGFQKN